MIFSKRHRRGLASGSISIDLDPRLRMRLWRQLTEHDFEYGYQPNPPDPWTETTSILAEMPSKLTAVYGTEELPGIPPIGSDEMLKKFIVEGPDFAPFDAMEIFVQEAGDGAKAFPEEVNRVFAEEEAPWRLLGGEIVLLDADFHLDALGEEVAALTASAGFHGALEELRHARSDRLDGRSRSAIHNAGSSFESIMKALGAPQHAQAKDLIDHLDASGLFDDLPHEIRKPFKKIVLMSLPFMRNNLGGHGQGKDELSLPGPYAELAVNLASSLEKFLLALSIEKNLLDTEGESTPKDDADPVSDFSATDIPF